MNEHVKFDKELRAPWLLNWRSDENTRVIAANIGYQSNKLTIATLNLFNKLKGKEGSDINV